MNKIPNLQNSAEKVITFQGWEQSHRYKALDETRQSNLGYDRITLVAVLL